MTQRASSAHRRDGGNPGGGLADGCLRVGFVVCPEFPLMSLAGFIEALRHAADRGDQSRKKMCSWTVMSLHGRSEMASCGLTVSSDRKIGASLDFDRIVVIGPLLRQFDTIGPGVFDYIDQARRARIPLAGICTGSFLLARAGVLKHRVACLHPFHARDFAQRFPGIPFRTDRHFIETGNVATVPGGTSVLRFADHVIHGHLGSERSSKMRHQTSLPGAAWDGFATRRGADDTGDSADPRLNRAVSLMERTIETGGSIPDIAAAVDISERQLNRLFRQHFDTTPKRYWLDMRLEYCRWLTLNTDRSITNVAFVGGFSDSAHFITQFRKAFGVAPGEMRRAARKRLAASVTSA